MKARVLFLLLLLPLFGRAQSIESLDIKNGFLQFKLGDSISNYSSMIDRPEKATPNRYPVKSKAISLKHRIYKLELIVDESKISEIEATMSGDQEEFMDKAIKKAYGEGYPVNGTDTVPGKHVTYMVWVGKRVSALLKKMPLTPNSINGRPVNLFIETFTIKKTSDIKVDGVLSPDFPL